MEIAVVINKNHGVLAWHNPPGSTNGSIPQSYDLWKVMWENRDDLEGVAHSHPGSGATGPSYTDVTTWSGCELGLGKRLLWWITTSDQLFVFWWVGPEKYDYAGKRVEDPDVLRMEWVQTLRDLSYNPQRGA